MQKYYRILKQFKKTLAGKSAADMAVALTTFVVKFAVHEADRVYGQARLAKMVEIPTAEQVCRGSLCTALEQTLLLAQHLGCFVEFVKPWRDDYGQPFDILKTELQNVTYLALDRPVAASGVQIDFAHECAQKMGKKARLIVRQYDSLFTVKNYPEEIETRLNELGEQFRKDVTKIRKNLGTNQASSALSRFYNELVRFIIINASEFFQRFPNENRTEIYQGLITVALLPLLRVVSRMDILRAFSNELGRGGTPTLNKIFEVKMKLHGPFIVNPEGQAPNEESEDDQSELSEKEKREAARRKQKEKDRKEAAINKRTTSEIDTIIELLADTVREWLDTFEKRDTSNYPL
jgi:hypothetical protein